MQAPRHKNDEHGSAADKEIRQTLFKADPTPQHTIQKQSNILQSELISCLTPNSPIFVYENNSGPSFDPNRFNTEGNLTGLGRESYGNRGSDYSRKSAQNVAYNSPVN